MWVFCLCACWLGFYNTSSSKYGSCEKCSVGTAHTNAAREKFILPILSRKNNDRLGFIFNLFLCIKRTMQLPALLLSQASGTWTKVSGMRLETWRCRNISSGICILRNSVVFHEKASSGHGQWPTGSQSCLAPDHTSCDTGKSLHVAITASGETCVCLEPSSVNVACAYHDGCLKTSVNYACDATKNLAA